MEEVEGGTLPKEALDYVRDVLVPEREKQETGQGPRGDKGGERQRQLAAIVQAYRELLLKAQERQTSDDVRREAETAKDKPLKEAAEEDIRVLTEVLHQGGKKLRDELVRHLDPHDPRQPIIIEVSAAGSTASAKQVDELTAAYAKLAQTKGWKMEIISSEEGKLTLRVEGRDAYEYFRDESGKHEFKMEERGRMYTNDVTVAVLAAPKESRVVLREADVEVMVSRSGGAGGQHVNKTESKVHLRHKPTGIEVVVQDERSQARNRERAMEILKLKLEEKAQLEAQRAARSARSAQVGTGGRASIPKIRVYNLKTGQVTDQRSGQKSTLGRGSARDFDPEVFHDRLQELRLLALLKDEE